jgi:AcrR family transcriptional regulator
VASRRSRRETPTLRKAIEKHKHAAYQEAILEAACNVFGRVGFGDAKMADIAAEAGVSVGTLYNYFDSKDSVISSLTTHEHAAFRARAASMEAIEDPLERIRKLVEMSLQFIEERGALLVMAVQSGLLSQQMGAELMGANGCDGRAYVLKLYEDAAAEAAAAGKMRKDLSPARIALALEGMATAMILDWVRSGRAQSLVAQSEFVFDLFMKGVKAR